MEKNTFCFAYTVECSLLDGLAKSRWPLPLSLPLQVLLSQQLQLKFLLPLLFFHRISKAAARL